MFPSELHPNTIINNKKESKMDLMELINKTVEEDTVPIGARPPSKKAKTRLVTIND